MKMKSINRESISALLAVLVLTFVTAVAPSSVQVHAQSDLRPTTLPGTTNVGSAPSSTASVKAAATLADLRTRIEEIVRQPALEPGFFAVKVVSLDSGQVIYEQNANKFVRPASNM